MFAYSRALEAFGNFIIYKFHIINKGWNGLCTGSIEVSIIYISITYRILNQIFLNDIQEHTKVSFALFKIFRTENYLDNVEYTLRAVPF